MRGSVPGRGTCQHTYGSTYIRAVILSTALTVLLVAVVRMDSVGTIDDVAPTVLCCRPRASLGDAF